MDTEMKSGMSAYEQFVLADKTSRHHTSGTAIAGLVLGTVGTAIAAGAWIFAPIYANARAKSAESQNAGTAALLNQVATLLATERAERRADTVTLNQTITDTVSGSQQGSQNQSVTQDVVQQVVTGLMTGRYTENAQKVELISPAKPFTCGCGCGQ